MVGFEGVLGGAWEAIFQIVPDTRMRLAPTRRLFNLRSYTRLMQRTDDVTPAPVALPHLFIEPWL